MRRIGFSRIRRAAIIVSLLAVGFLLNRATRSQVQCCEPSQVNVRKLLTNHKTNGTFDFHPERGIRDKWGKFAVHPFVRTGTEWDVSSMTSRVCAATHVTMERLYQLVDVSRVWKGPISTAVFTPDVEADVGRRIVEMLRRCVPEIRRQVSFHFVTDLEHPPKLLPEEGDSEVKYDEYLCSNLEPEIESLLAKRSPGMMEWRVPLKYPQNLMRNVARSSCNTPFTFLIDVDMVPMPGLKESLDGFLESQGNESTKCVYVIPTYEIHDSVTVLPRNKTELLRLVKKKLAQPFHVKVAVRNSQSSDLRRWASIPESPDLEVAYNVTKYQIGYEPVYVARADIPPFDERFLGYGCTRYTQAYEMYVADYQFLVLNNAFTSHRGFQTISSRPGWRAKQHQDNMKLMRGFAEELKIKYKKDPKNFVKHAKMLSKVRVTYGKPK
ncbi:unnamed protein product [Darwinula stevensoni]|uniref:Beta-1,4-glucuronyltransferase 1 n=1 Tax=Darwinula stevensoni TaxID=69355 RepID=A0A7R8X9B5_9CRUS|nr:unnamed protein product [Darwinula stevensoni]CAG0890946.1 unnamed protein product [Darwinula stevensoni]